MFLIPALALFALIFAQSIIMLVGTSFTDWAIGTEPAFTGLSNYVELFHDKAFLQALLNTVLWIVLQSTVHVALGVTVALILARKKFYWKFVRTVYMIPNIMSAAAVGVMFSIMLNPQFGIVNRALEAIGLGNLAHNWFMDKDTAFGAVTVTWLIYAATVTILTLAELSAIDKSVFEAAAVDGASEWQTIRFVTLPMLRNIIGTCTVLSATSMLQKLDILMMTTRGGPQNYTLNLPLYIYNTALKNNNFALANAAGVVLILAGLLAVLLIQRIYRMGQSDL